MGRRCVYFKAAKGLTGARLVSRLFGQSKRLQSLRLFTNHSAVGLIFHHSLCAFFGTLFFPETCFGTGAGIIRFGCQYRLPFGTCKIRLRPRYVCGDGLINSSRPPCPTPLRATFVVERATSIVCQTRDVAAFDRQSDDPVVAVHILARKAPSENTCAATPNFLTFRSYVWSRFSDSHSKELRPFILR